MDPKIQTILDFMKANLHCQISVGQLARLVKLSQSRLCRRFLTEVGVPPLRYLKSLRMEKACEYLEASLLLIKEIAAEVGYKDPNYFMREFKKTYGLTPSEYRSEQLLKARLRGQVSNDSKIV